MACKVSNVNNTESLYQLKRKLALYSSNHDLGKETVDFSECFSVHIQVCSSILTGALQIQVQKSFT